MLKTLTDTVHTLVAGMEAPVTRMLVADGLAITVAPAQVVVAAGVGATTRPDGSASVTFKPVKAAVFVFSKRSVNTATAPGALLSVPVVKPAGGGVSSVSELNALCTVNGDLALKVSLVGAVLLTVAPPIVALKPPAGIVFT